MTTSLKTACPSCAKRLRISESKRGKTVRCPACRETFVASDVSEASQMTMDTTDAAVSVDTTQLAKGQTLSDLVSPAAQNTEEPTLRKLGRFELKSVLGAGGFGKVYRAYDPQLERFVALKVPTFGPNQKTRIARFLAEAKAAARLKHANIVSTFESGKADKKYYIASEYIKGELLSQRIKTSPLTIKESVELVRKLADALAYAHSQNIVHRDIKPHNVMVDSNGEPQLMDFGLAKRLDDDSKVTTDGALLGTPAYMSPEQARGELHLVTGASDQYSLGVVLFHLLTGKTPRQGSPHMVIAEVAKGEHYSARHDNPTIPADVDAICQKSMSGDITQRYQTCGEFAEDLAAWLEHRPVKARPLSLLQRTKRVAAANSVTFALFGLLMVFALLTSILGWNAIHNEPTTRAAPGDNTIELVTNDGHGDEEELRSDPVAEKTSDVSKNGPLPAAAARPDILFEDFEGGDYDHWKVDGVAFGQRPYEPLANNGAADNPVLTPLNGRFVAHSLFGFRNAASGEYLGSLTSEPFVVDRKFLCLQTNGQSNGRDVVRLLRDGKNIRSVNGLKAGCGLRPVAIDVSDLQGQKVQLQIIDDGTSRNEGTCVDNIVFSDVDLTDGFESTVRLAVRENSVKWNDREYLISELRGDYHKHAVELAQLTGGKILTIDSTEEQEFLSQHLKGSTWIGAEWKYEKWVSRDGINYSAVDWRRGRPDDLSHRYMCYSDKNGFFSSRSDRFYIVVEFGPLQTPDSRPLVAVAANRRLAGMLKEIKAKYVVLTNDRFITQTGDAQLPSEDFEIRHVRLDNVTKFTANQIAAFAGTQNVMLYELRSCDSSVLGALQHMPNLKWLDVYGGDYGPWQGLETLQPEHPLQSFSLLGVKINDNQIAPLFRAKGLQRVSFTSVAVSPEIGEMLRHHSSTLTSIEFNLAGGLQSEGFQHLAALTNVTAANLWACGLTDDDLQYIGKMQALKSIQLAANGGVSGAGLKHLAGLSKIESISLGSTALDDQGLTNLPPLPALKSLSLRQTKLTGAGLGHLSSLPSLRSTNLESCKVSDADLQQLYASPTLLEISAKNTSVTPAALKQFRETRLATPPRAAETTDSNSTLAVVVDRSLVKRLIDAGVLLTAILADGELPTRIDRSTGLPVGNFNPVGMGFWNKRIAADALEGLETLETIKSVDLQSSKCTGEHLRHLPKSVTRIGLFGCKLITDASLREIPRFENLGRLDLRSTSISSSGLSVLVGCHSVWELSLVGTNVDDGAINHLMQMTNLTRLLLDDTEISEQGVETLKMALPKCTISAGD